MLTLRCSQTYPNSSQAEEVRQGYEPSQVSPPHPRAPEDFHNLDEPFAVGDGDEAAAGKQPEDSQPHWQRRDVTDGESAEAGPSEPQYGSFNEERNAWNEGR